jgi:hypothetical protein
VASITYCKDKIESYKREETKLTWRVNLAVCQTVLEIRGIRKCLSSYIVKSIKKISRINEDGRIRSTFSLGPETGRWSAGKFVDGSGFNAQTLPRDPVEIGESEIEAFTKLTNDRKQAILQEVLDEAELEANELEEDIEDAA